jgi:pheromone shutdown-related protein TraB
LTDNLTIIETGARTVYLLGTAHVSRESADEAEQLINRICPDTVCVELDADRIENMENPKQWNESDIAGIVRQKKSAYLLINLIISSYQKRLAKKFGISVGQEMLAAMAAARQTGCEIYPIDRSIKVTFMRIWRKMRFMDKMKLLFNLIFSFVDDSEGELSEDELEKLKTQDMIEAALSDLGKQYPQLKQYLVDERDVYLSQKIKQAPGKTIVAVVGAAHKPGILLHMDEEHALDELETVPPKPALGKIIGWIVPALIVLAVILTFSVDKMMGWEQLKQWILYNGILSAFGTLIAGGNILSVITAFAAAPITSLNPLLAAGWFAGLVEAKLIKPTVADFNALSDDLSSFKGLRKNKMTRILLVVIFANIGSIIGTYLGGIGILRIFHQLFMQ